jgi:hypothetical protein
MTCPRKHSGKSSKAAGSQPVRPYRHHLAPINKGWPHLDERKMRNCTPRSHQAEFSTLTFVEENLCCATKLWESSHMKAAPARPGPGRVGSARIGEDLVVTSWPATRTRGGARGSRQQGAVSHDTRTDDLKPASELEASVFDA